MYFQIRKLILWPRGMFAPRIVEFEPGVVNVISGLSKTGKSAVIPIIDYCLGAGKCAIPVGVIRESCSWFGVVVQTIEGEKLFARREPGDQQNSGDMFVLEDSQVEVPNFAPEKNTNVANVKLLLNRLAGLTNLEFEPDRDNGFKAHPSFRDLMAFTFQPQNVVANPDVMFFKADTTEHREKLKTIFPYVLQAVTAEVLMARHELERLSRILRRMERDLASMRAVSGAWEAEARAWLRQSIELSLLPEDTNLPEDWPTTVDLLRVALKRGEQKPKLTIEGIDGTLERLEQLRNAESDAALLLTRNRQQLAEVRRLSESSEAYAKSLGVRKDRLKLSEWLRGQLQIEGDDDAIALLSSSGKEKIEQLSRALESYEIQLQTHPLVTDSLNNEELRLRGETERSLAQLNNIRREIEFLEKESAAVKNQQDRYDQTERFLGRLEQALLLYDRSDDSAELRQEISLLKDEISRLRQTVSEAEIQRKLKNAIDTIEAATGRFIPQLDAEWPEAPVRLVIRDLTVQVIRGSRADYLWEIGSGANWLAYHVALTLALQKFFLQSAYHPVPSFLIYDQPSQVYFPRTSSTEHVDAQLEWKDEDVAAIRRVFKLLGEQVTKAEGRLQVIVLDHADDEVWGDLLGVKLIEDWHDSALVPREWATDLIN